MIAEPTAQAAEGKVLWHFTMSLDGFVAGPGHSMDWMAGLTTGRPHIIDEYVATTGAVLGGRDGFDAFPDASTIYGGAWSGPVFVLTHHPEDAPASEGTTILSCDVEEALRIAKDAAGGKNVEILSASIGRQLLDRGLLDEIDLHIAPVLLGDGIRLYDNPGAPPIALAFTMTDEPRHEVNVRARPIRA
ncbi:dihydrofolate reductase [Microbacterium sp. 4R-513]|uniref:dihydrofolate reductase family protein n=1 Tax=Microbacterium sp. 4R-513 TaxID=2567934 RepID=UPI0013E19AA1|nr:dihydrofolate reductase family protein [Microbacterium sp. 4R-513]QIG39895.1 dihydrofolate reductase [Microbacterium sp. 4R-513]